MKIHWFVRRGIIFVPTHLIGWLLLAVAIIIAVYIFIDVDGHSHSVSDTLINFVFYLIIIGVVYTGVAFVASKRE